MSAAEPIDALALLNALIDSCTPREDVAFWILTSAAAHVSGLAGERSTSTAALFFWGDAR